ncbi:MAG: uracil-DNA glycosylase [Candidatus Eremiobacteraeota bacterium]|nr:uracil-DNA glycosylase [Candidatus Eremiobacteraeota bacterium]
MQSLEAIEKRVVACRRCPELRAYCAEVGRVKKRAFLDHDYWARPVPGWGDPQAGVVLVGLAPGAHGSNRTGRVFTGDGSGEWLFRALHRAGFASQPNASHRADGLTLRDAFITAAVRCAPPANKPTPQQKARCFPYLRDEFAALTQARVVVTLGKIADDTVHTLVKEIGAYRTPRAPFAHLAETIVDLPGRPGVTVLASYHPSRQNTNTGVLTEPMLDAVFSRARELMLARGGNNVM